MEQDESGEFLDRENPDIGLADAVSFAFVRLFRFIVLVVSQSIS